MKIESVRLENFRGIRELELEFQDPGGKPLDLVVLAGPNGCGKTSVLEACLLACDYAFLPENKDKPKYNIHNDAADFEIRLRVRDSTGAASEVVRTKKTQPLVSDKDYDDSVRGVLSKTLIEYFSSWREPKLVGSRSVTAGKRGKRPLPNEENRLWIVKQYLIDLTAYRAFRTPGSGDGLDPEFQRINAAWKLFYPNRDQRFIAEPASENIEEGFDLFLKNLDRNARVPVDSLSAGEIEVLTMLGWFAIKKSSVEILFIDEPELHLHQSWHRAVLKALRKVLPDTQIICATHSPEVLDSVDYFQRFTLLEDDDPRIRFSNGIEVGGEG